MLDEKRRFSVTYCEDVRLEMTGQTSLIGIFPGLISAAAFPLSIPKFCLYIEVGTPLDLLLQHLHFEVKTDSGLTLVDQTFPSDVLQHQTAAASSMDFDGLDERLLGFRTQFFITPLVIQEPTIIRAKIITELGEVKGRALKVQRGHPVQMATQIG